LTVGGMIVVGELGLSDGFRAAVAAAALMVSLAFASLIKAHRLARLLKHPVNNWRWPLVWAAAPAIVLGWATTRYLPEWAELTIGIPVILGVYCWVIWRKGFGPEDRVLFRRN